MISVPNLIGGAHHIRDRGKARAQLRLLVERLKQRLSNEDQWTRASNHRHEMIHIS